MNEIALVSKNTTSLFRIKFLYEGSCLSTLFSYAHYLTSNIFTTSHFLLKVLTSSKPSSTYFISNSPFKRKKKEYSSKNGGTYVNFSGILYNLYVPKRAKFSCKSFSIEACISNRLYPCVH